MRDLSIYTIAALGLFALTAVLLMMASRFGQTRLGFMLALSSLLSIIGAGTCMFLAYAGEDPLAFDRAAAAQRQSGKRPGAADRDGGSGQSGDEDSQANRKGGAGDGGTGGGDGDGDGKDGSNAGRARLAFPSRAAEAAKALSGNAMRDCDDCPELVIVDSGFFRMGAAPEDREAGAAEMPSRMMMVPRRFAIGRYEVTVGQFQAFARATRRQVPPCLGSEPKAIAGCISWRDAVDYVAWLKTISGRTYRLPSEIEWEWAARGGSAEAYTTGARPTPRLFNGFGLVNIHGGVAELVGGCWTATLKDLHGDATRTSSNACKRRVMRDAGAGEPIELARLSARRPIDIDERRPLTGIRVVREMEAR